MLKMIGTTIEKNRRVWKNHVVVNRSFLWAGIFYFVYFV